MNKKRISTIVVSGLALVLFYLFPEQRVIALTVLGAIIGMFGGVGAAIIGGLIFLVLSANNYIIPIVLAVIIGYNILLLAKPQKSNTSSDSQITDPDSLSDNQVTSQNSPQIDTAETKDVSHPVIEPKTQNSPSPTAKIHRLRRALHDFVVLDIETTGLNKTDDQVIQVAAVKYEHDKETGSLNEYLDPIISIPPQITRLTGITNAMVQGQPTLSEFLPTLDQFVGNLPVVGHNINRFDIPFLAAHGWDRTDFYALDTLPLARRKLPGLKNYKLPTLKKYFGLNAKSHDALNDCRINGIVYMQLRDLSPNKENEETDEEKRLRSSLTKEEHSLLENGFHITDIAWERNSTMVIQMGNNPDWNNLYRELQNCFVVLKAHHDYYRASFIAIKLQLIKELNLIKDEINDWFQYVAYYDKKQYIDRKDIDESLSLAYAQVVPFAEGIRLTKEEWQQFFARYVKDNA